MQKVHSATQSEKYPIVATDEKEKTNLLQAIQKVNLESKSKTEWKYRISFETGKELCLFINSNELKTFSEINNSWKVKEIFRPKQPYLVYERKGKTSKNLNTLRTYKYSDLKNCGQENYETREELVLLSITKSVLQRNPFPSITYSIIQNPKHKKHTWIYGKEIPWSYKGYSENAIEAVNTLDWDDYDKAYEFRDHFSTFYKDTDFLTTKERLEITEKFKKKLTIKKGEEQISTYPLFQITTN